MKKLYIGDTLAIAFVTAIGFAFHGTTDLSVFPRFLLTYIPLTVSWFLVAPWLGLFQTEITSNPKLLWRPALAVLFAAPLAALVRAMILNSAVVPIFATILAGTSALGMVIWRGIYLLLNRKGR
ncbi:MAG: hypothetical protein MHPDNHAH_02082 [Anaerolineales bacterium]|nr:hypothetical protein [Anaerolineales bacterium]